MAMRIPGTAAEGTTQRSRALQLEGSATGDREQNLLDAITLFEKASEDFEIAGGAWDEQRAGCLFDAANCLQELSVAPEPNTQHARAYLEQAIGIYEACGNQQDWALAAAELASCIIGGHSRLSANDRIRAIALLRRILPRQTLQLDPAGRANSLYLLALALTTKADTYTSAEADEAFSLLLDARKLWTLVVAPEAWAEAANVMAQITLQCLPTEDNDNLDVTIALLQDTIAEPSVQRLAPISHIRVLMKCSLLLLARSRLRGQEVDFLAARESARTVHHEIDALRSHGETATWNSVAGSSWSVHTANLTDLSDEVRELETLLADLKSGNTTGDDSAGS
jgi:hypothetical protein